MVKFLNNLQTLQANFTQTLIDEQGIELEQSFGTVVLVRPNKFRWDYVSPDKQIIVSDGSLLWIYDEALEQIIVRDMQSSMDSIPMNIFAYYEDIKQHFTIQDMQNIEQSEWVKLIPHDTESQYTDIRLGFEQGDLISMIISDAFGHVTHIDFSNTLINSNIDEEIFNFEPPAGIDIVGDLGSQP